MLDEFRAVEKAAARDGLSFGEAMRLLAGAPVPGDTVAATAPEWSTVVAGPWLRTTLAGLRDPDHLAQLDPGAALKATLRPYQHAGVRWLHLLSSLGLGACLADDMGLGKTMQVLALLLILRKTADIGGAGRESPAGKAAGSGGEAPRPKDDETRRTSLLVAPASLLANWAVEIERFAPTLIVAAIPPASFRMLEIPRRLLAQELAQLPTCSPPYVIVVTGLPPKPDAPNVHLGRR
jgi:non-specific serine/threonine protein kinase